LRFEAELGLIQVLGIKIYFGSVKIDSDMFSCCQVELIFCLELIYLKLRFVVYDFKIDFHK